MFLPFNSVSEWSSLSEDPNPFTTTGATVYGTQIKNAERYLVGIFTTTGTGGTITAKKDIDLNIICVGGGGGGASSAYSNSARYGGGGGGVVIVTRRMTRGTNYVVTVGAGGAGGGVGDLYGGKPGSAGGHSSISNVATNFIVQGDGGAGGPSEGAIVTSGGRGHPYSINTNNPETGGNGAGGDNGFGNTSITTTTTNSTTVTGTARPQFKDQNGLSISINTVVPPTVMEFSSYIKSNYSGGGGRSRRIPAGPAPPGGEGTTGGIIDATGIPANAIDATSLGSGGGGAGAKSNALYVGGKGAPGIVIVWVAY